MSSLDDPRRHDDLLNFRFKRVLTLGGAPAVRLCEGRYGISRLEWRLLAALVEGGACSPGELVRDTGVEQARASRSLAALVDKKLARRDADPVDRRRATLQATEAGAALYGELFPQLAAINRRLAAALDANELEVLDRCLAKLTARAREVLAEGGGVTAKADRRLGGSRRVWAQRPAARALPTVRPG